MEATKRTKIRIIKIKTGMGIATTVAILAKHQSNEGVKR